MSRFSVLALLTCILPLAGCSTAIHCFNAPSISGQPSSQIVAAGDPALFTVASTGSGAVSFQWTKNGQPIAGATQPSLLTAPTTAADSGASFAVTLSNYLGSVQSAPASLTVILPVLTQVLFVAPTGSDTAAGTIDQPFRTIQHCASALSAGGTCQVRAGTYRETVIPSSNTTITAYHFETVTIDGSDPITGWTLDHGAVYKAHVTLSPDDTNQVFLGAAMMTEARWPNGDDLFHVNWAHAGGSTNTTTLDDPTLPAVDWTGARIHLWSGTDPFGHQTGAVTSSAPGRIGIDVGQSATCPYICPVPNGLYYLYGSLNALDAEREWFYDASSSTLYFMAPGGVDPTPLDVRAKQRPYAFDLRGKTSVTLRNLAIFGATIITDQQSAQDTLDRITAQYVSQFTELPTAPDDPTGQNYSILQGHHADTGIILFGTGNTIQNSSISWSAGAGIALEGNGNTVRNNLIQNIDYVGNYSSGINLDGNNNTVQFNTITTVGRQAIDVEGAQNQDLSYNNLFNGMLLSRDGAEIYACCQQSAAGTRIHHNWLHDTIPPFAGQGDTFAMSGLVIDNGSAGFQVDQNVLWNNHFDSVLINGVTTTNPNNNQIVNNTVPDADSNATISVIYVPSCATTHVTGNRVATSVTTSSNGTPCTIDDNTPTSLGASEMTPSTQVGCNFNGCASSPPPIILESGNVTACPVIAPYQKSQP